MVGSWWQVKAQQCTHVSGSACQYLLERALPVFYITRGDWEIYYGRKSYREHLSLPSLPHCTSSPPSHPHAVSAHTETLQAAPQSHLADYTGHPPPVAGRGNSSAVSHGNHHPGCGPMCSRELSNFPGLPEKERNREHPTRSTTGGRGCSYWH